MRARFVFIAAGAVVLACRQTPAEKPDVPGAVDFNGTWASTTKPYEFVRLTTLQKSTASDVFDTKLAFSGLRWEGDARLEGDSLVATLRLPGGGADTRPLVVRALAGQTIRLWFGPRDSASLQLDLVRER